MLMPNKAKSKKRAKAQKLPAHASNNVTVKVDTGKRHGMVTLADGSKRQGGKIKKDHTITSHQNGTNCLNEVVKLVLSQFGVDHKTKAYQPESNYTLPKLISRSGEFYVEDSQLDNALKVMIDAMTTYRKDARSQKGKDGGAIGSKGKSNGVVEENDYSTKDVWA